MVNKGRLFMNKKTFFAGSLLSVALLLGACIGANNKKSFDMSKYVDEQGQITKPYDTLVDVKKNNVNYNKNKLLLKSKGYLCLNKDLENIGMTEINKISPISDWYSCSLAKDVDAKELVDYLRKNSSFEEVDLDYIYEAEEANEEFVNSYLTNPYAASETQLDAINAYDAWKYMEDNESQAGGSENVIVAVIDTGVDYNHEDLKNNIWTNSGEIPNNGIDDDENGYIDDVHGWDFVGYNNNPMDDNGHGTHVAGIIASENNSIGTVGVAYNCKIMPIKAGNSSGYFNQSAIASAVTYAYMNGASVINMSFGGTTISLATQEALEEANATSVLVAAAGNDGLPNQYVGGAYETIFPSSLSYITGVMSSNGYGLASMFTNYDPYPYHYNSIEYDVFAPGEQIVSTFPNNKYATMSGTSMATPVVAGIAALIRSAHPDSNAYSSKFIQSQLVETGTIHCGNMLFYDEDHTQCDAYLALSTAPKPSIKLYNTYTFDNADISSANNGDKIIEAGETINVGVELYNRGGVAKNVVATIDTYRIGGQEGGLTDPYIEILTPTVDFTSIGTYSIKPCEFIKDDKGNNIDVKNGFRIKIADNCPDDYICTINVRVTYENGMDARDTNRYEYEGQFNIAITNGIVLPNYITEDTVFEGGKLYIVANDLRIPQNVSVVFEEGSKIQFYVSSSAYEISYTASPRIYVYGSLELKGSSDNFVNVNPSDSFLNYLCYIQTMNGTSCFKAEYTNFTNCKINCDYGQNNDLYRCTFIGNPYTQSDWYPSFFWIEDTNTNSSPYEQLTIYCSSLIECSVIGDGMSYPFYLHVSGDLVGNLIVIASGFNTSSSYFYGRVNENNLFVGVKNSAVRYCNYPFNSTHELRFNYWDEGSTSTSTSYQRYTYYTGYEPDAENGGYKPVTYIVENEYEGIEWLENEISRNVTTYTPRNGSSIRNNAFVNNVDSTEVPPISFNLSSSYATGRSYDMTSYFEDGSSQHSFKDACYGYIFENNYFSHDFENYARNRTFREIYASTGYPAYDIDKIISEDMTDSESVYPFVRKVEIKDSNGDVISHVGVEQATCEVTFSRPMDMEKGFSLHYGSRYPYNDYTIEGVFVDEYTWVGTFVVSSRIEGGIQHFRFGSAFSQDGREVYDTGYGFNFIIDISGALSMTLTSEPTEEGVKLTWAQDDYDTLMGYNIYRCDTEDGQFVKVNNVLIAPENDTYIDGNINPGQVYYYYFTVVLSDFSESKGSSVIPASSLDTIAPTVTFTPIHRYTNGGGLTLHCRTNDNIGVQTMNLYYKTESMQDYVSIPMVKNGTRFSGTIPSSALNGEKVSYYLEASDGRNVVYEGDADNPYVALSSETIELTKGDVDGDGFITTKDALMIMQAISGERTLADEEFARADLNGDGELSASEVLRILQYINGKVDNLDM